jgi:hypothetical protein
MSDLKTAVVHWLYQHGCHENMQIIKGGGSVDDYKASKWFALTQAITDCFPEDVASIQDENMMWKLQLREEGFGRD